jgi:hypothetical protein
MVQGIGARAARQARLGERVWAALVALLQRPEPVEMVEQRFNYLPRIFRWRGDVWRVRSVVRVWDRPGTQLHPPRRYFEIICGQSGRHILIQDLQIGAWHLSV